MKKYFSRLGILLSVLFILLSVFATMDTVNINTGNSAPAGLLGSMSQLLSDVFRQQQTSTKPIAYKTVKECKEEKCVNKRIKEGDPIPPSCRNEKDCKGVPVCVPQLRSTVVTDTDGNSMIKKVIDSYKCEMTIRPPASDQIKCVNGQNDCPVVKSKKSN